MPLSHVNNTADLTWVNSALSSKKKKKERCVIGQQLLFLYLLCWNNWMISSSSVQLQWWFICLTCQTNFFQHQHNWNAAATILRSGKPRLQWADVWGWAKLWIEDLFILAQTILSEYMSPPGLLFRLTLEINITYKQNEWLNDWILLSVDVSLWGLEVK